MAGKRSRRGGRSLTLPRRDMEPFTRDEHRAALVRRRIKFVAEKGAMARLFRKGTNTQLQRELFRQLQPSTLARPATRDAYDAWLT